MNSRQRIKKALNHEQPDKLPVDFGRGLVSDINARTIYKLRQYYGLDKPGTPVKLIEPFWGVGEIKDDLREIFGSDVKKLEDLKTSVVGIEKTNWKEWKLDDGTPVLVPGIFNTKKILMAAYINIPREIRVQSQVALCQKMDTILMQ